MSPSAEICGEREYWVSFSKKSKNQDNIIAQTRKVMEIIPDYKSRNLILILQYILFKCLEFQYAWWNDIAIQGERLHTPYLWFVLLLLLSF